VLTSDQVAKYWFGHTKEPYRHAMRCLRGLESLGSLKLETAMLKPIDVSEPLYRWPEDGPPNCGQLAWKARARFHVAPKRTVVAFQTDKFAPGRPPRITELQHDSMLASVFLRMASSDPAVFDHWKSEDEVRGDFRNADHVPDAVMLGSRGHTLIECIGKYSKTKIASIHEAFRATAHYFY
jgi:hypothetical protein